MASVEQDIEAMAQTITALTEAVESLGARLAVLEAASRTVDAVVVPAGEVV